MHFHFSEVISRAECAYFVLMYGLSLVLKCFSSWCAGRFAAHREVFFVFFPGRFAVVSASRIPGVLERRSH
jgi:hypothetical protein